MTTLTDCLVLKIEENRTDYPGKIDTRIFVLYDKNEKKYIIRGKRDNYKVEDNIHVTPASFSFQCDRAKHVESFIRFIVCSFNTINLRLYNFDNLPEDSDEITYYFLEDNVDLDYEIAGYDNEKYSKETLITTLKNLKNVFNYY